MPMSPIRFAAIGLNHGHIYAQVSLLLRAARVAAWLDGRIFVAPEDVQAVFAETIAHRLCYQPVYELHRHEISPRLMSAILGAVAAP